MTTLRISEAAAATGFSADTLRYYERIDLVVPSARTDAGYRLYDDDDLDALRFVAHAKSAGLSLDDVAELLALWRTGDCGPVRDRLHELVCERADSARTQGADLLAFADRLDGLVSALAGQDPPARCGPGCGCGPDVAETALGAVAGACSLPADGLEQRLAQWREVTDEATAVEADGDRLRITLPPAPGLVARAAELATLEQSCCGGGLLFDLHVAPAGAVLDITGSLAPDLVDLVGATATPTAPAPAAVAGDARV